MEFDPNEHFKAHAKLTDTVVALVKQAAGVRACQELLPYFLVRYYLTQISPLELIESDREYFLNEAKQLTSGLPKEVFAEIGRIFDLVSDHVRTEIDPQDHPPPRIQ